MAADETYDILIVGGGHAGAQAAIALRQRKFTGTIAIVGDEAELPYERPPLSKEYFSGQKTFDRILIRPEPFWVERNITMLTGTRVISIDAKTHLVKTDSGSVLSFGRLVWATGGSPRRLTCAGHDLIGVHSVRTRADVDRMMVEMKGVARVAVIGGGYIGLEAAAVLVKLGKHVTVLEQLDRVLARVAGEPLSRFYEAEHRSHGVDIRLGVTVACVEGSNGRVTGVRLEGGEFVAAEMVIVGIGIAPAVDPLMEAGAEGENGVAVDAFGRTSLPDIFAVGDCALHANTYAQGAVVRLESVQNANDMATTVAQTITGDPTPYHSVPWFWSNQYDLRLQTVGLSIGYDTIVIRGNIIDRSFSIIYLKQGRVIALDCVNATKDYVQGKSLVAAATAASLNQLSNSDVPLKEIATPC